MLASPRRYTQVLLVALSLGSAFRNYWTYSRNEHQDPSVWMSFVNGTGLAPEQYRVGVKLVAWWMVRHVGGGFRHSFALMDVVSCIAAGLLLYALLRRSRSYRDAGASARWAGSAVFLVLFSYYLSWLPWFEKAETLPSVGLVAGLLWLWTRRPDGGRVDGPLGKRAVPEKRAVRGKAAGTVAGLLVLTVAQALVRADVAFVLSGGVFAVALSRRFGHGLALPRPWGLLTSAAGALLAAGAQLYLMRVAYPHATYGDTPVFMLRYDFAQPLVVGPFLLFLLPVGWTVYESVRVFGQWGMAAPEGARYGGQKVRARIGFTADDAAGLALLLGGLLYLPVWMVLGKLDEVRIFMPFALASTPLTTELVLRRVRGNGEELAGAELDVAAPSYG